MRKQMVTGASATWLTSTAPLPTGFLPSHPLTRYVLPNMFVFASSWIRGPELLTARSALACVPVPRGEFLWEVVDWPLPSDREGMECDPTTQSQLWFAFCNWPRMFRGGQNLHIYCLALNHCCPTKCTYWLMHCSAYLEVSSNSREWTNLSISLLISG